MELVTTGPSVGAQTTAREGQWKLQDMRRVKEGIRTPDPWIHNPVL